MRAPLRMPVEPVVAGQTEVLRLAGRAPDQGPGAAAEVAEGEGGGWRRRWGRGDLLIVGFGVRGNDAGLLDLK